MIDVKSPYVGSAEPQSDPAAARSRAFALLATAALLRSMGPGAVNYWQAQHIVSEDAAVKAGTQLASLTAMTTSLFLLVVCLRMLTRYPVAEIILSRTTLLLVATLTLYFFRTKGGSGLDWRDYLDLATLIGLVVSVSAIQPRLRDLRVFGVLGVAVALYSIAFALVRPANAFMVDTWGSSGLPGKAIIGGRLLAGPTSHSNTLGILLALCTPWVLLFDRRRLRLGALGVMICTLAATASRTSLIAVGVALVLVLAWHLPTPAGRRAKAYLWLAASSLICATVPLLDVAEDAFSGRGGIWRRSLEAWQSQGSPLTGLGPYWSPDAFVVGDPGLVAEHSSGHSLLIQWLVTGGPVQLLLGGLLIAALIPRAVNSDLTERFPVSCAYVTTLLVVSTTEFTLLPEVGSQLAVPTILMLAAIAAPPTAREISASSRRSRRPRTPARRG